MLVSKIQGWDFSDGNDITSLDYSPDGRLVAAGFFDFPALVWDVALGQLVVGRGDLSIATQVVFAPDGQTLAMHRRRAGRGVHLQHMNDLDQHSLFDNDGLVAFLRDGTGFVTIGDDQKVRLRELPGGQVRWTR